MSAPLTDEELHQYRDDLEHGTLSYQQQLGLLRGYAALKRILDTRTLVMPGQCTEEERAEIGIARRVRMIVGDQSPDWVTIERIRDLFRTTGYSRREAERAKGGA